MTTGADHRNAVHQSWIETSLSGKLHIGRSERVERDGETARCRTSERCEDIGGDGERDQRPSFYTEDPFAHQREGWKCGDDRAEADEARH